MSALKKLAAILLASTILGWSDPAHADPAGVPTAASIITSPSIGQATVSNPRRTTVALALGGGGVRGAAHIGVLRVLEREGIRIDYIAGTSMGSVIGGMYAAGVPLDVLEQMFRDRSVFKAFTPVPPAWKLTALPARMLLRSAKGAMGMTRHPVGLYATNKLADFVSEHLPPDRQNVEQTAIPFAAVATNLLDGKAYSLESGSIGKAIQASSALPFYVEPIQYEDKLLVDGGLRANVPTLQAKESGADIVISVDVNENLQPVDPQTLASVTGLTNRITSIMLEELNDHSVELADLEIRPTIVNMSLYSRNPEDALTAIRAGEEAANVAMPKIRALLNSKLAIK